MTTKASWGGGPERAQAESVRRRAMPIRAIAARPVASNPPGPGTLRGIALILDPVRPVQPQKDALHPRQEDEREKQGKWQPDHDLEPAGRILELLQQHHSRHHDMADGENREIRRGVVNAIAAEIEAAGRAGLVHGDIAAECRAPAAARAAAGESSS